MGASPEDSSTALDDEDIPPVDGVYSPLIPNQPTKPSKVDCSHQAKKKLFDSKVSFYILNFHFSVLTTELKYVFQTVRKKFKSLKNQVCEDCDRSETKVHLFFFRSSGRGPFI